MSRRFFSTVLFAAIFPLCAAHAFNWQVCLPKGRNHIQVVGSSTISPFLTAISEEFSREQNSKNIATITPVVESTGTGSGFKMFCGGVGEKFPDLVNASRAISDSEMETCSQNDVKQIVEIKIGYDGIVFGNVAGGKKIKLTKEQLFLALAEKVADKKTKKLVPNFYQTWREIDPKLPNTKILVYGPPASSGTRDVFADIVLEEICLGKKEFVTEFPEFSARKKQCHTLRSDEHFIESGENDRLIIEHLKANSDAFGIFGFNFLSENKKTIQAVSIEGVSPNATSIASKKYSLSRPLFVYFKKENLNSTPQMRQFISEIINPETIGPKGYLVRSGLIALSDAELDEVRKNILSQL
ncbi:MAG: substrate-binding domain-containing protein [Rickettsiales bacterium]|nr:substrate-binding domain-containing protein [Rickettsiales bacterium]